MSKNEMPDDFKMTDSKPAYLRDFERMKKGKPLFSGHSFSYQEVIDLFEFAEKNHDTCADCDGTGKIYKHNDPTTGQWVPCPISEILEKL